MTKILYCKRADKRKRDFQIQTTIIENEDGEMYVIKEPLCNEASSHITKIHYNAELLKDIYKQSWCEYRLEDNAVYSAYYEYDDSLANRLDGALTRANEKEIKEIVLFLKKIIIGNENNKCDFHYDVTFQKVFGEANELIGDLAVKVSNIDLNPDNIIFSKDGNYKVIDYEWVFDFPVPFDFIIYYSLLIYARSHNKTHVINKVYEIAGIKMSMIPIYEKMISSFYNYISFDKDQSIDYRYLGMQFLKASYDIDNMLERIKYKFPEELVNDGCRLAIYGAGNVGTDYYSYAKLCGKYTIEGWFDKRAESLRVEGEEILPVNMVVTREYDYILIGVLYENIASEIKEELMNIGVSEEKILWKRPEYK